MFWRVVWFRSQISKVKGTVFYSSKLKRNIWASHYTSGARLNAKTKSTCIKRMKVAFPLFHGTDLQFHSMRWMVSTDRPSGADFRKTRSQNKNYYIDRDTKNNRTMAQPDSKLRSWDAKYLIFLCTICYWKVNQNIYCKFPYITGLFYAIH